MTEQRVAAVQMVSSDQVSDNLAAAERLAALAADQGANLVALPENFAFMGAHERAVLAIGEVDGQGRIQDTLSACAQRLGLTLVAGSVPLRGPERDRVRSACLVYGPDGERIARYDKRHLFDVALANGEGYQESATFAAGQSCVVADSPAGRLGLSICYDLRFPEHYRDLIDQGAEILLAPAAFTAQTGAAHWSVLTRARAIENLSYLVAPGQGGEHASGRYTHGESVIIGPWGETLDHCPIGGGEGVAIAAIDRSSLPALRERFPALSHRQ